MAAGHCSLTSVSNSVPSRRRCTQHTPSSIRHLLCHNVTAPAASKTKYTCQTCGANAWAKPNTPLICGACYDEEDGEITIMTAETMPDEQQEAA